MWVAKLTQYEYDVKFCRVNTVVKVRVGGGVGELSPLLPFQPPCNSMGPPD